MFADAAGLSGEWEFELYEVGERYAELSDDRRERVLAELEPDEHEHVRNTVTDDHLDHIVDVFDPNQSPSSIDASHIALGTDDTTPSTSNSSLNSEQYREQHDSTTDNDNELEVTIELDTTEGNGNDFVEAGIFSASSGGTMFNHSTFSKKEKRSSNVLKVRGVLIYDAA